MIKNKEDFVSIEAMISSDGWKLFQDFSMQLGQGFLSKALSSSDKDEVMIELTKYKAIKDLVQGVFGDYKNNYNQYNGVE